MEHKHPDQTSPADEHNPSIENGFASDPEAKFSAEAPVELEKIIDTVTDWKNLTLDAVSFVHRERRLLLLDEISDKLKDIFALIDLAKETVEADQTLPEEPRTVLIQQIGQSMQEFDLYDEALISLESQEETGPTPILHAELAYHTTDVSDPEVWLRDRLQKFPTWAVDGIRGIDLKEELSASETFKEDHFKRGNYMNDTKSISLSTFSGHYDELRETNDEPAVRRHVRHLIEDTLDHEIAHYMHERKMSIDQLRQWVIITKQEKRVISEYAGMMLANDYEGAEAEAFADSLVLYKNSPETFIQEAPERFKFLNKLLGQYSEKLIHAYEQLVSSPDATDEQLQLLLSLFVLNKNIEDTRST